MKSASPEETARLSAARHDGSPAGTSLPKAASDSAPTTHGHAPASAKSAADQDFMRWMPIVVPMLGVSTALLTGLMWLVAGKA